MSETANHLETPETGEETQDFDASKATALWLAFIAANMTCLGIMTMLLAW